MTKFVHIHSSSRYDRTSRSLDAAMDNYQKTADLITVTEVSRETREDALSRAGWGVIVGDKTGWDDCGIVFKRDRFKVIHRESFDMGGRWAQIAVLDDLLTGHVIVVS